MTGKRERCFCCAAFVAIPVLLFYLEAAFTYNPFERTTWRAQLLNILFLEAVLVLLFMITARAAWALRIETALVLVIGIANYYVITFRGEPIVPWDFLSLRTAANVAGGYSYNLGGRQIALILAFVALLVLERFVKFNLERRHWCRRLVAGASSVCVLAGLTWVVSQDACVTKLQLYPFLFTPNVMYERNGFAVTFLMDLRYLAVEKPENYDPDEIRHLLDGYDANAWTSDGDNETGGENLPNIFVIMNEAFSDPGILGEFDVDEDYMPFVHSLQKGSEAAITGMLNVSVKGGNTANTEFEFLTGQSMAFLPAGSIPYQQYVRHEVPSMASYLKSLGYETVALHPYYASGWNRDKVYPLLGFDRFLDKESYRMAHLLRGYVDDMSCTDQLIKLYENREKGTPLFAFNVTMQNHSPYTKGYQFADGNVAVNGITHSQMSEYLSLIRQSDAALEALVEYFREQQEPTVIVFFGDHQPSDAVVAEIKQSRSAETEDEFEAKRYEVPYVIWANFHLDGEGSKDTSANFLGANVLKAAGVPVPDYMRYLLELENDYPVISTQQLLTAAGGAGDLMSEEIQMYRKVQYYLLFDSGQERVIGGK